ncbi:hypothetical protein PDIDSM_2479 [Penicillium digitatum]|nr:hypothetical protein PDIDSM_2479 [Penicillium digitatum]
MSKRTLPQQRPTQPQPMRYQGQQRYPHPYGRTIQTQGYQLPFRSRDIGTDTPQLTWSLNRDLQRQRRNTYPHPPSLPQGQLQRKSYAPPQLQQPSRQQQSAHNQSRTNQEGQLLLSDKPSNQAASIPAQAMQHANHALDQQQRTKQNHRRPPKWPESQRLSKLIFTTTDKAGTSHPIDGQRNGKRPGPSSGGKINMDRVSAWMVFHFSIHNYWDLVKQEACLALSYVRLTDEGIFYCLCTMTPYQLSSRFQADFDQHGDVRTSRIPLDPPMIIWANGLPWFPVYKAFYVLCGSWNPASHLVGRKYRSSTSEFFIGVALAPADAVRAALEDSLPQLTLRAFDSLTYPSPDRTNGPIDLIHVGTISRGQNKIACRFIMNKDPTFYVLVYKTIAKKDLTYTRLHDLNGFHEDICDSALNFSPRSYIDDDSYEASWQNIPESDFHEPPFACGKPFPARESPTQDAAKLKPIPWKDMYAIIDSFGNEASRRRKRAQREKNRQQNVTSGSHIPLLGPRCYRTTSIRPLAEYRPTLPH